MQLATLSNLFNYTCKCATSFAVGSAARANQGFSRKQNDFESFCENGHTVRKRNQSPGDLLLPRGRTQACSESSREHYLSMRLFFETLCLEEEKNFRDLQLLVGRGEPSAGAPSRGDPSSTARAPSAPRLGPPVLTVPTPCRSSRHGAALLSHGAAESRRGSSSASTQISTNLAITLLTLLSSRSPKSLRTHL